MYVKTCHIGTWKKSTDTTSVPNVSQKYAEFIKAHKTAAEVILPKRKKKKEQHEDEGIVNARLELKILLKELRKNPKVATKSAIKTARLKFT